MGAENIENIICESEYETECYYLETHDFKYFTYVNRFTLHPSCKWTVREEINEENNSREKRSDNIDCAAKLTRSGIEKYEVVICL